MFWRNGACGTTSRKCLRTFAELSDFAVTSRGRRLTGPISNDRRHGASMAGYPTALRLEALIDLID